MAAGMLIVPMATSLGVHGRSATATSSFLIIWGAATANFVAIFSGLLKVEVFLFFFGLTFIGGGVKKFQII